MAGLPEYSVSECDPNSPAALQAMNSSSSAKISIRSNRSRITLVDWDTSLETKIDVLNGTIPDVKRWSRFDHLLAALCVNRQPKRAANASQTWQSSGLHETRLDRSPWILPVYVLSRERDEHRHLIPREAKCTIDTGNLQGNIVSRAFLVDVLGYSEPDFCKLTKYEDDGGTGITGHKLIPVGAINLTWYHANSTRVFREMRFLISEHPMYDLIIGAHSIRSYSILDAPNLMTGGNDYFKGAPTTDELKPLEEKKDALFKIWNDAKTKAAEEKGSKNGVSTATKDARAKTRTEFEAAKKEFADKLEIFYRERVKEAMAGKKPEQAQKDIQNLEEWFLTKTGRALTLKEKDQ